MDNSQTHLAIEPYKVYSLKEAGLLLGVRNRKSVYKLAKPLKAKIVGNSYKTLGENILAYMGSPTVLTQQMQPNKAGLGVPTQEEVLNSRPNTNEALGVPPQK